MKYRYLVKQINADYPDVLQETLDDAGKVGWKLDKVEVVYDYDTLYASYLCIFYQSEYDE